MYFGSPKGNKKIKERKYYEEKETIKILEREAEIRGRMLITDKCLKSKENSNKMGRNGGHCGRMSHLYMVSFIFYIYLSLNRCLKII